MLKTQIPDDISIRVKRIFYSSEFPKAAGEEPFSVLDVFNVYSTLVDVRTRPTYGLL